MFPGHTRQLAWKLLALIMLGINVPAFGLLHPDAGTSSITAFRFVYDQDEQIEKIIQNWPNKHKSISPFAIRYNQPIIQQLIFSNQQVGPTGKYLLPSSRVFRTAMRFFIQTASKQLAIEPGTGQPVIVEFMPTRIKEKWIFNSGLELSRAYYQTPNNPTTIIRFKVNNKSNKKIAGFRFKTTVIDPEMTAPSSRLEQDDELYADPRNGVLFLRDSVMRDENWLALAWAPSSGLITSGSRSAQDYRSRKHVSDYASDLQVTLETPVIDLEKGQTLIAEFILTWGRNKEAVSEQIHQLRKKSEYDFWLGTVHDRQDQALTISCESPYISYVSKIMQAWSKRQFMENKDGPIIWSSMDTTQPASPKEINHGWKSFLALGYHRIAKNYLNNWLDKRQESPDAVYIIQMVYDYITWTGDLKWLKDNAVRLEELLNYINKLDDDQDGLPNFRVLWQPFGLYQPDEPSYNIQETDLQLFEYSLASILAYRYAGELFALLSKQRYQMQIKKYARLANQATKVIEENYWDSQLGRQGFYSFGRLDDRDLLIHKQHISAIECYLKDVGPKVNQQIIFSDCWTQSAWRNEQGFFKSFIESMSDQGDMFPINDKQYQVQYTHMMLDGALKTTSTAKAAYKHLKDYSQHLCSQPDMMALPADSSQHCSSMSFSSLSYIDLVLKHVGGLQVTPKGLIINKLNLDQPVNLTIENLKLHKKNVTLQINKIKKGRTNLTINGKKAQYGQLIELKKIKEQSLVIKANYGPVPNIKKKGKKRKKSSKRSRRRPNR